MGKEEATKEKVRQRSAAKNNAKHQPSKESMEAAAAYAAKKKLQRQKSIEQKEELQVDVHALEAALSKSAEQKADAIFVSTYGNNDAIRDRLDHLWKSAVTIFHNGQDSIARHLM